jgi:anionic cell wall polymer biosynthesis LytR-Cps2A-Psr (LCP) family protein
MPKRHVENSALFLVVIIVLAIAGVVSAVVLFGGGSLDGDAENERVISTLFIFENNGKPAGAYVLLYYPQTKRAAAFDIPGELGLILKQINRVDRIDAIYENANIVPYETEIARLLDIEIQYRVVFTMDDLRRVIDLIDGIEIFIPQEINIYDNYTDHTNGTILFPSGFTALDGEKTCRYFLFDEVASGTIGSVVENGESALSRRERVFVSFIKRLGEKNELLKQKDVDKLYRELFRTNMNRAMHTAYFDGLALTDTRRLSIQAVGGNYRDISGSSLLLPYYDGTLIKGIVRETLAALVRQTSAGGGAERVFTVEVLNGTTVAGLAARTAELLRGFGYDVIGIGNAPS